MEWGNLSLIAGMAVALATAAVALYRARPQRDLDTVTRVKIDQEVQRLQTSHDTRRTMRLLRLEAYVDQDIDYHRQMGDWARQLHGLLLSARDAGFLPAREIPEPPKPPELPAMPDDGE